MVPAPLPAPPETGSLLRLALQSIRDHVILILDPGGHVVSSFGAPGAIRDFAASRTPGRHFSRHYPEEARQAGEPERNLTLALRHGSFEIEGWRLRDTAEPFWARVSFTAIRNEAGEITGVIKMVRDCTLEHNADEQRRTLELKARQSQKMEALGTLAGGISHDFNNLLAAVLTNVELLRWQVKSRPEALEFVNQIAQASLRARDLVQRILAFSRSVDVALQPIDLVRHTRAAVQLAQFVCPAHIRLEFSPPDCGVTVIGEVSQWTQVVTNLCANARDAYGSRHGVVQVALRIEPSRPREFLPHASIAVLEVTDHGTGMDPETVKHIFEPFFTSKESGKGTGLGLTIVHSIAQAWSGRIDVESRLGQGTRFRLLLPLATAGASSLSELAALHGTGQRIMVVDDECSLAISTAQLLRGVSYETEAFTSSMEALEVFERYPRRFHCLVCDYSMPGLTGEMLVHAVRLRRPEIPVVLMTGFDIPPTILPAGRGLRRIRKPFTLAELSAGVHSVLAETDPHPSPPHA